MSAFLSPAGGGIQPINGKKGAIIDDIAKAERGKPGKDIIVSTVNQIIAATQISLPANVCDPQAQLQRVQQQIQERVQLILEQYIVTTVQQTIQESGIIQGLQQQLQTLQQQQSQGLPESLTQQVETIEKDIQSQLNSIIIGVVGRASTQLPQAAKLANTSVAGIKTVASVAESLSTFVPSQGINMSAYGTQKTIQTVSQACSL